MKKLLVAAFVLVPCVVCAFFFSPGGSGGGSGGGSTTTDASLLTSGILPAARIGDGSIVGGKMADNTAFNGKIRFDTTNGYARFWSPVANSIRYNLFKSDGTIIARFEMDDTGDVYIKSTRASDSAFVGSLEFDPTSFAVFLNGGTGTYFQINAFDNVIIDPPLLLTAPLGVASGGTGSNNATGALTNLGVDNATLNFATTGTLTGGIMHLDNVSGPTAAQMYGSNNVVNAAITVLLPTAVQNMSGCVTDGAATATDIIVDVQAGDNVILTGVTQAGGVGITNASGSSLGDYVCFIATAANKWRVYEKVGTWVSQ